MCNVYIIIYVATTGTLFSRNHNLLAEINESLITLKEAEDIDFSTEDSFLLVYQTKKQKEWLEHYGDVITCMDGVYKTLRYGFPCYFLVVKTSIGRGRVVGTIIPQYETEELIAEGLKIINQWCPQWNPKYFMTDKSSQELGLLSLA